MAGSAYHSFSWLDGARECCVGRVGETGGAGGRRYFITDNSYQAVGVGEKRAEGVRGEVGGVRRRVQARGRNQTLL